MIDWNDYPVGDSRIMCPVCGKKPTDKNLGITILQDGTGVT